MSMTDPVADMLTRIRNGAKAEKKCSETYPPETIMEEDHKVSCWLYSQG